MQPTKIRIAALLLFTIGGGEAAWAAPGDVGTNYSTATQDGSSNAFSIEQTAGLNAAGNSSTIEQVGDNNHVQGYTLNSAAVPLRSGLTFNPALTGVIQGGSGGTKNKSEIYQDGDINEAAVAQRGVGVRNNSSITQNSDGNIVVVDQGDSGSTTHQNKSTITQGGGSANVGNLAIVYQSGDNDLNMSLVTQTGDLNDTDVRQSGVGNTDISTITQTGSENGAHISQSGGDNVNLSTVTQTGDNGQATITQQGNSNVSTAHIVQQSSSTDAEASILQEGSDNTSVAIIVQTVGPNLAEITQRGGGSFNNAEIHQHSSGNTAIILQEGAGLSNSTNISQSVGANYAYVHQQ